MKRRVKHTPTILFIFTSLIFCIILTSTTYASKRTQQGYLGVSIERLSREDKEDLEVTHGVLVIHVMEDGPADKAGIQEDDIIQYFGHKKIRRPDDLVKIVRKTKPESEVKVTCTRDTEIKEIAVTVGRYKSHRSNKDKKELFFWMGDQAYLGVKLQELNEDLATYFGVKPESGALILEISDDSPAEEAGLKPGDVIIEFDEEEIHDSEDIQEILQDLEEEDEIEMVILRHGKRKKINVTLAEKPHSKFKIFKKDNRDNFNELNLHLNIPDMEDLELPEIDCDIDCKNLDKLNEAMGEKFNHLGEQIKNTVKQIKECYFIL